MHFIAIKIYITRRKYCILRKIIIVRKTDNYKNFLLFRKNNNNYKKKYNFLKLLLKFLQWLISYVSIHSATNVITCARFHLKQMWRLMKKGKH